MRSFHPIPDSTVSISASTTSANVALSKTPSDRFQVRVYNAGSATVFINRGSSTVTATTSNMPVPAGAIEVITFNNLPTNPITHVAAITSSGTATVYFTTGDGI